VSTLEDRWRARHQERNARQPVPAAPSRPRLELTDGAKNLLIVLVFLAALGLVIAAVVSYHHGPDQQTCRYIEQMNGGNSKPAGC
jgi:hypothetical protein